MLAAASLEELALKARAYTRARAAGEPAEDLAAIMAIAAQRADVLCSAEDSGWEEVDCLADSVLYDEPYHQHADALAAILSR